MKSTSSNSAEVNETMPQGLKILLITSVFACVIIFVLLFQQSKEDPFIKESLSLTGSFDKGSKIFRMNCVGCHGISAQGLVGPKLNNVTEELNDNELIKQISKGLTPPMPSFEMDSQTMADLLAYLHKLKD